MYVVNYWHTATDYAEWKKVFDSDPLGRDASGVGRYSIERPLDDEHTEIGELEFDSLDEAKTFAGRLEEAWKGVANEVVSNAGHRITEVVEQRQLGRESGRRAAWDSPSDKGLGLSLGVIDNPDVCRLFASQPSGRLP